jgi:uncharacterized protein (TIGR03067 family)
MALIDQELGGLSDKHRDAIVLCDMDGVSRREAARLLGVPDGTLSGRLTEARRLLAGRLARRGVTISAGALAALLAQDISRAAVPAALAKSTVTGAIAIATGGTSTGAVSGSASLLAERMVNAMFVSQIKVLISLVLVIGITLGGAAYWAMNGLSAQPAETTGDQKSKANIDGERTPKVQAKDEEAILGTWVGHLGDAEGKAVERFPLTLVATKDNVTITGLGQGDEAKKRRVATYTINSTKKPKTIELVGFTRDMVDSELEAALELSIKTEPFPGIYTLEGNTLKICIAYPGRERPKEFKSNKDGNVWIFECKRDEGKADVKEEGGGQRVAKGNDKEQILGTWEGLAFKNDGQHERPRLKVSFAITAEKIKVSGMSDAGDVELRYRLDSTKKFKTIDMTAGKDFDKQATLGIYELSGDTLRICSGIGSFDERPTEFRTKADTTQWLMVLHRRAKEDGTKDDAKMIQGTWHGYPSDIDGKPNKARPLSVTFSKGKLTVTGLGDDIKKAREATYRIDPGQTPKVDLHAAPSL